jgi:hypothetical protein
MLDNEFGIDLKVPTLIGTYYTKNGGWNDGTGPGKGHEEHCVAYFLPQDMELVVLVNSPIGQQRSVSKLVSPLLTRNIVPA